MTDPQVQKRPPRHREMLVGHQPPFSTHLSSLLSLTPKPASQALLLEHSCLPGTDKYCWSTEGLEEQLQGSDFDGSSNWERWLPLPCHLTDQSYWALRLVCWFIHVAVGG